jgi:hypothetical protein
LFFTEEQGLPSADEEADELAMVLESVSECTAMLGVFGEGGSGFIKRELDGLLGTGIWVIWVSLGELGRSARFAMSCAIGITGSGVVMGVGWSSGVSGTVSVSCFSEH